MGREGRLVGWSPYPMESCCLWVDGSELSWKLVSKNCLVVWGKTSTHLVSRSEMCYMSSREDSGKKHTVGQNWVFPTLVENWVFTLYYESHQWPSPWLNQRLLLRAHLLDILAALHSWPSSKVSFFLHPEYYILILHTSELSISVWVPFLLVLGHILFNIYSHS